MKNNYVFLSVESMKHFIWELAASWILVNFECVQNHEFSACQLSLLGWILPQKSFYQP